MTQSIRFNVLDSLCDLKGVSSLKWVVKYILYLPVWILIAKHPYSTARIDILKFLANDSVLDVPECFAYTLKMY